MTKFRIRYVRIPTAYSQRNAAVVEAETAELAVQVLAYQLGDKEPQWNGDRYSGSMYVYYVPEEWNPPPGRVLTFSGGEA